MENILDETLPEKTEFNNCKVRYLLAQNKLMNAQLGSVTQLLHKYKAVIDILSKNGHTSQADKENVEALHPDGQGKSVQGAGYEEEIRRILRDAEGVIENCIEASKQIVTDPNIFQQEQGTITPAFFSQLVLSYEQTIAELKHSIHQREILLQQLQSEPEHQTMHRAAHSAESPSIIKAIEAYDVYPRISEKCRQQILELKMMKKELGKQPGRGHVEGSQIDKTVKKIPQYLSGRQAGVEKGAQAGQQTMSTFQKTILIYKKKKIFNDILESRVLDLKNKIKQKQAYNQILKRRLQHQLCSNIENINQVGRNLDEDDPAYLSMLNQSLRANNLDFSVDISRVMPQPKTEPPENLENILEEIDHEGTQREGIPE